MSLESINDNQLLGGRIFIFKDHDVFSDPDQTRGNSAQVIDHNLKGLGSAVYYEVALRNHQLSTSANISESDITKIDKLTTSEKSLSNRKKLTAAISDTWQVQKDLSIQAMYRAYFISDEATIYTVRPSDLCDDGTTDCGDSTYKENSWQLGLAHQINDYWKLKLNTGKFFRFPTLTEKFGNFGDYKSEPELEPEESFNSDIGIIFNDESLHFKAVGFYKKITNGIFIEYDSSGTGHPTNIGESWIAGIEGSLGMDLSDNWILDFTGHAMDSENQSEIKAYTGQKIFGFYHFSFFSSLTWHNSLQSLSLNYQVDDDLSYNAAGIHKADKKALANVSYSLFIEQWTINFSIDNLLDKPYTDYARMPSPGRSYFATINYEFN